MCSEKPLLGILQGRSDAALESTEDKAIFPAMSTVQEIEEAADRLPLEEKEGLLRFLAISLRKERTQPHPRIYSPAEISSMLAEDEADGERLRKSL